MGRGSYCLLKLSLLTSDYRASPSAPVEANITFCGNAGFDGIGGDRTFPNGQDAHARAVSSLSKLIVQLSILIAAGERETETVARVDARGPVLVTVEHLIYA